LNDLTNNMVVLAQWIKHTTLAGGCLGSNPRHRHVFLDFVCPEYLYSQCCLIKCHPALDRFFKTGVWIGAMARTSLHNKLYFRPVSKHHNIKTLKSQLLISKTLFLIFRLVSQFKDKIKLKYLYIKLF